MQPVKINDVSVEVVNEYKYLGTVIDSQVNWNLYTTNVYKKANQRLHFLRNVNTMVLKLFYTRVQFNHY